MVADAKSEAIAHLKQYIGQLKAELVTAERALADLNPVAARVPQAARIPKAVPVSNATGLPVAEALVQAVARSQGRDRAAIVAEALPNMKTTSDDPRKTAQTRLGQLIAEEIRLVERDGLVYLK